jgi:hypothetical protein
MLRRPITVAEDVLAPLMARLPSLAWISANQSVLFSAASSVSLLTQLLALLLTAWVSSSSSNHILYPIIWLTFLLSWSSLLHRFCMHWGRYRRRHWSLRASKRPIRGNKRYLPHLRGYFLTDLLLLEMGTDNQKMECKGRALRFTTQTSCWDAGRSMILRPWYK